MNEEEVLARIQELMDFNGWTLYKLAKESGLSYTSLSSAFKRGSRISTDSLQKICSAFQISYDEFFQQESNPLRNYELTEDEQRMLNRYRALSGQKKQLLWAYLDGMKAITKDR